MSVPVSTILDSDAGPKRIPKKRIDHARLFYIRLVQSPRLLDASKRMMELCNLFHLNVAIGEFRARLPVLAVYKRFSFRAYLELCSSIDT